jgi:uncharacterized phage infection (PIP) family protein YhgE
MVSEQPQNRSDTMIGSTPKAGSSSQKAASGSSSSAQTDMGAKAQDVVEQTQQKVGEVADQAKQQATSQLSTQKDRAVESLGTVADALRQTGKHLHENDQHGLEHYANKAAERVEQFSGQLRNKDVQEIVRDVERYARQQPALFLGGAFVLGLLGARFLKSTAQRDDTGDGSQYRDQYGSAPYGGYRPGYSSGAYGDERGSGAATGRAGAYGMRERSWYVRGTEMQ